MGRMPDAAALATPTSALAGLEGLEDGAGRYSVFEPIGEGGMGTVHLALELLPSGEKKRVAVKRMRPDAAKDPRNLELFFREARLATMLRHPNVAQALSFGRIGQEPYIAMEYIAGRTLDAILDALRARGRSLDVGMTCFVAAELCEGLHAVHSLTDEQGRALGVVHRDVTPHNVIVAFDGSVRLLDFGIAKVTEDASKLTRTGEVRGKMAYMSPEQALGEKVEARSDLFSVGAVFYECITGERMWGDGAELELMRKLALEAPPKLGDDTCIEELAELQHRLVAKRPNDRPADASAVAAVLRKHVDDEAKERLRGILNELFGDVQTQEAARLAEALDAAPAMDARGHVVETDAPVRSGRPVKAVPIIGALAAGLIAVAYVVLRDPRGTDIEEARAVVLASSNAPLSSATAATTASPERTAPAPVAPPAVASSALRTAFKPSTVPSIAKIERPIAPTAIGTTSAPVPTSLSTPTSNVDTHPF